MRKVTLIKFLLQISYTKSLPNGLLGDAVSGKLAGELIHWTGFVGDVSVCRTICFITCIDTVINATKN